MISIIIPTYKEEKYIHEAISQFNRLTIPHEIIVTDDCSPDKTLEIARSTNVIVIEAKQKHPTIAANRNAGAKSAKGEFLVFLDADSRILDANSFFERALHRFSQDQNQKQAQKLVAITGSFWVSPDKASLADILVYSIFNIVHRLKNNVLHTGEAPGKFQMIRNESFLTVNGFREDLVSREDADIFQRLNKIGRTFADRELVVYHSGRRSRAIGWPKLLWIWMRDSFSVATKNVSASREWKAIR
ncbi:MAG: glycosyltransferase [Candidatus Taylorbacteria bacterium]